MEDSNLIYSVYIRSTSYLNSMWSFITLFTHISKILLIWRSCFWVGMQTWGHAVRLLTKVKHLSFHPYVWLSICTSAPKFLSTQLLYDWTEHHRNLQYLPNYVIVHEGWDLCLRIPTPMILTLLILFKNRRKSKSFLADFWLINEDLNWMFMNISVLLF